MASREKHHKDPRAPDASDLGVTAQPGRQSGEDKGRAGHPAWAGAISKHQRPSRNDKDLEVAKMLGDG